MRLAIPALKLAAAIVPVNATAGALAVPSTISEVGWWSGGGIPGAASGTAVLDGHVDSALSGLGALWPLRSAQPGYQITLSLAGGHDVSYRVVAVRAYDKADLPASLFIGRTGPAGLVVITCGGRFDRSTGHYGENVVVYAKPSTGT